MLVTCGEKEEQWWMGRLLWLVELSLDDGKKEELAVDRMWKGCGLLGGAPWSTVEKEQKKMTERERCG